MANFFAPWWWRFVLEFNGLYMGVFLSFYQFRVIYLDCLVLGIIIYDSETKIDINYLC